MEKPPAATTAAAAVVKPIRVVPIPLPAAAITLKGNGKSANLPVTALATTDPKRQPLKTVEMKSDAGLASPVPAAFLARAKAQVREIAPNTSTWLPRWASDLVAQNAHPDAVVGAALQRVTATPNEATLSEVQGVLNDVGRSADGTSAIAKVLSQDLVNKLVAAGRKG